MSSQTFQHDEVIFREDTFSTTMYEVVAGRVGIYKGYGTPNQKHLATLKQGATFGEMGLAEYYPRSATAVALDDATEVYEVSASEFSSYFTDRPEKVLDIMRQLSGRIRDTNAKYVEACQTVYDAIEQERAGKKRSGAVAGKLSDLVKSLRLFGK